MEQAEVLAAADVEFAPANVAHSVPVHPAEVTVNIDAEIQKIFDTNRLADLKKFLGRRQCLNRSNMLFEYAFHVVQTSGILVTTIAAGYNEKFLVWIGAGISAVASLIKVFESSNNSMLKKLLNDIHMIRNGTYVDEGVLVDEEKKDGD